MHLVVPLSCLNKSHRASAKRAVAMKAGRGRGPHLNHHLRFNLTLVRPGPKGPGLVRTKDVCHSKPNVTIVKRRHKFVTESLNASYRPTARASVSPINNSAIHHATKQTTNADKCDHQQRMKYIVYQTMIAFVCKKLHTALAMTVCSLSLLAK
jgi:hypothetical protein